MTVTVDAASCIGCSMCAYAAPGIFRMENRVSTVLPEPDETQYDRAAGAANPCLLFEKLIKYPKNKML